MSRVLSGWRAALRMATRETRRAKGRSLLVVTLIGLPVLALTFAAASYDMFTLTTEERLVRELGAADARLHWYGQPIAQQDARGHGVSAAEPPTAGPDHAAEPPTTEEVAALLPPGSRVIPEWHAPVRMTTATGAGDLDARALDLSDPVTAGMLLRREGRAPASAAEVAITPAAADRLGVGVGDEVELRDTGARYRVVGVYEDPGGLWSEQVVFHPDGWPGPAQPRQWLVASPEPITWDLVRELNQHGITSHSRAVVLDPAGLPALGDPIPDGQVFAVGVVVAGLAVLEIVLLAGPAFAVGARRRRRELALLAAGGGAPSHLRRIVLADGVVLGAAGAVAGLLLGVAAAVAARPLLELYVTGERAGGYRFYPSALAAIAVAAVGVGVLAALVPAVTAARAEVVAGLAGRRGVTRSRRRWLVLGLVMVVAGGAVAAAGAWRTSATTVVAGLALGQLGLVLCTPRLVGLVTRLGARLPLTPRIALRDTARNRAAAAPAISAVMAAVAGAATAGIILVSLNPPPEDWGAYPPGTVSAGVGWSGPEEPSEAQLAAEVAEVEGIVREHVPVARVYEPYHVDCFDEATDDFCKVDAVMPAAERCPYADRPQPLPPADQRAASADPRCRTTAMQVDSLIYQAADEAGLPVLTGRDPAALTAAAAALRAGGVVVRDPRFITDGHVTVRVTWELSGRTSEHRLPAAAVPEAPRGFGGVLSPGAADRLGLTLSRSYQLVISTTRMPTVAEEDALAAALEARGGYADVRRAPGSETDVALLVLAVAAGVIALGAAGIATGLAAADRRGDLSTLGAVGASPRVRRLLSLSQSGVIAGLGTVLGLAAGVGAALAVLFALNQRYATTWPSPDPIPLTVPWLPLVALLAVPVVAMLGAGLLTRSRLPIERRLG